MADVRALNCRRQAVQLGHHFSLREAVKVAVLRPELMEALRCEHVQDFRVFLHDDFERVRIEVLADKTEVSSAENIFADARVVCRNLCFCVPQHVLRRIPLEAVHATKTLRLASAVPEVLHLLHSNLTVLHLDVREWNPDVPLPFRLADVLRPLKNVVNLTLPIDCFPQEDVLDWPTIVLDWVLANDVRSLRYLNVTVRSFDAVHGTTCHIDVLGHDRFPQDTTIFLGFSNFFLRCFLEWCFLRLLSNRGYHRLRNATYLTYDARAKRICLQDSDAFDFRTGSLRNAHGALQSRARSLVCSVWPSWLRVEWETLFLASKTFATYNRLLNHYFARITGSNQLQQRS